MKQNVALLIFHQDSDIKTLSLIQLYIFHRLADPPAGSQINTIFGDYQFVIVLHLSALVYSNELQTVTQSVWPGSFISFSARYNASSLHLDQPCHLLNSKF